MTYAWGMATKRRNPVRQERRRVLQLMKAHRENFRVLGDWGEHLYVRLTNMIRSGVDLEAEMKLPIDERVMFFHWPDGS